MMLRNFPRAFIHVLERTGLALIGAAAGLLVALQTGSSIPAFTNVAFLFVVMLIGATGFYLGIDVPSHRFQPIPVNLPGNRFDGKVDASELMAAVGTVLAALATFISAALIALAIDTTVVSAGALLAVWGLGALMQVAAGATAR